MCMSSLRALIVAYDRMFPREAEMVSEWTGLSGKSSVKCFERSWGLHIVLYKNFPLLFIISYYTWHQRCRWKSVNGHWKKWNLYTILINNYFFNILQGNILLCGMGKDLLVRNMSRSQKKMTSNLCNFSSKLRLNQTYKYIRESSKTANEN